MRLKTFEGEQQITKLYRHNEVIDKLPTHRHAAASNIASNINSIIRIMLKLVIIGILLIMIMIIIILIIIKTVVAIIITIIIIMIRAHGLGGSRGSAAAAAEPREVTFYAQASPTLEKIMEKDVHC